MKIDFNKKYVKKATEIAKKLKLDKECKQVILVGSVAGGYADKYSDIDLLVLYKNEPTEESLQNLLNIPKVNKFWLDKNKFHVHLKSDQSTIQNIAILYTSYDRLKKFVKSYPKVTFDEYLEISKYIVDGVLLNGDKNEFKLWSSRCKEVPEKLKKDILHNKISSLNFWFKQGSLELLIKRKDWLMVNRTIHYGIEWILTSIYLLNDKIFINPKRPSSILNTFNQNNAMNQSDIQNFLDKANIKESINHISKLKFNNKPVSYLIKTVADKYFINPKLLITKLQVEQQLIKGDKSLSPTDYQIKSAMGVGMYDNGTVIDEMQGFVNQVTYAAKYFRKFYDEAKNVDYTHHNVDGQPLKVVNASTFSLYKYTPHIVGAKLVYDVYKGFFGTDDLGGQTNNNNSGNIYLKSLALFSIITLLLLFSFSFYRNFHGNKSLFTWEKEVKLNNNFNLISSLNVLNEKKVTENDILYCEFRFNKIYQGEQKLLLAKNNIVIDSVNLTNPELVMPELSTEYVNFYEPFDIDRDGKKQEFIVQEYASCANNFYKFIRIDKDFENIEYIPIVNNKGIESSQLAVSVADDSFILNDDGFTIKFYDNSQGRFFEATYKYDNISQKIILIDKNII